MRCIEGGRVAASAASHRHPLRLASLAGVLAAMWLAGCGTRPVPPSAPASPAAPAPPGMPGATSSTAAPGSRTPPVPGSTVQPSSPAPAPAPGLGPAAPAAPAAPGGTRPGASPSGTAPQLPPPVRVRNWEEYRLQAARRMVAAHPDGTYLGRVPEPLLAIPVLEVELKADGHVREVRVLRQPGQARDTVQLAIEAVRRAGPFGPVEHLPRPWRFTEAFLFDDARRFKPRSLD